MLTELRIENFAIIQRLALEFGSGLITFTGETGAGKSILLDAIEALVGGRVDATYIRSGDDRAMVEATFRLPDVSRQAILDILTREDLVDDPDYLTLGRELRREGRTTARVNGRSVNVSLLKELGSYLVDIHGQSDHLSLLNVRQHLGLLDRYAGSEKLLAAYHKIYHQLQEVRRDLNQLRQGEKDAAHRAEMLTFQAEEIEAAHLKLGEEDELRHERDRLANAENLAALAQQSLTVLEEGSAESPAVSDLLGSVIQALASLSRIDSSQETLHAQAQSAVETLSDVSHDLQKYLEGLEFNPRRLEQVEERLDLIVQLKRKYGGSIESVLTFGRGARTQLDQIAHATERIAELDLQQQKFSRELAEHGLKLSQLRYKAATQLGSGVEVELADLSMQGARFQVDLQYQPDPNGLPLADGQSVAFDETGLDRVEFLIAPNPGEGFKPLVKIASGGETSRLMLALKNVLAKADAVPTLIFDEIDQGIGGRVGSVIGEKLWQLGRQHQVMCITHLPQLAAYGDEHFRVEKQVHDGRTQTHVEPLKGATRLNELAQMLGALSEANRGAAQEALDLARRRVGELTKK